MSLGTQRLPAHRQSTASDYHLQALHFDVIVSMPTNPPPHALRIPELLVGMASMNLNMRFTAPYTFGSVVFRSNNGNIRVDVRSYSGSTSAQVLTHPPESFRGQYCAQNVEQCYQRILYSQTDVHSEEH